jgi:elongation factor Ts
MASYTAADVKKLRELTGAGMLDCKKALEENEGNLDKAVDWLRVKGMAAAAKKAGRTAAEGLVGSYIHAGGKIGVLLEVNCETDFVALNEDFQNFVRDVAMHIAAAAPRYVTVDELPAAEVAAEREVQLGRVMEEGKPAHIAEKIVEGRMAKWSKEVCLLDQPFIKNDEHTVGEMLNQLVAKIGEKLVIRRFVRFEVGEGIEKKSADFAAEVAAQIGG